MAARRDLVDWCGEPHCPLCFEEWDVHAENRINLCCCKTVCKPCWERQFTDGWGRCPFCRVDCPDAAGVAFALSRWRVAFHAVIAHGDAPRSRQRGGDVAGRRQGGGPLRIARRVAVCELATVATSPAETARFFWRARGLESSDAAAHRGAAYESGVGAQANGATAVRCYRIGVARGATMPPKSALGFNNKFTMRFL